MYGAGAGLSHSVLTILNTVWLDVRPTVKQCSRAGGQNVSKIKKFLLSSSLSRVEFLLHVSQRPLISLALELLSLIIFSSPAPTNQQLECIIQSGGYYQEIDTPSGLSRCHSVCLHCSASETQKCLF